MVFGMPRGKVDVILIEIQRQTRDVIAFHQLVEAIRSADKTRLAGNRGEYVLVRSLCASRRVIVPTDEVYMPASALEERIESTHVRVAQRRPADPYSGIDRLHRLCAFDVKLDDVTVPLSKLLQLGHLLGVVKLVEWLPVEHLRKPPHELRKKLRVC